MASIEQAYSKSMPVEGHTHWDRTGACRFSSSANTTQHAENAWCPTQPRDIRSPCPALNALANHGYLNRSGKNIYIWDIAKALYHGYALTLPFSIFLCIGTLFLIKQWNPFAPLDLQRIGVHNGVEHDASMVHDNVNTKEGERYASSQINQTLLQRLEEEVKLNGKLEDPCCVDAADIARARNRREKECGAGMDDKHKEIARGEMAIALGMWNRRYLGIQGNAEGIPLAWLIEWLGREKLPAPWMEMLRSKTARRTGLVATVMRASQIRDEANKQNGDTTKPSKISQLIHSLLSCFVHV